MIEKFDIHDKCPNCLYDLDGGDIFAALNRMEIHMNKSSADVEKLAKEYGWTPTNKTRFTNLLSFDKEYGSFWQCPNCKFVWNKETFEQFESFFAVEQTLKPQDEPPSQ